MIGIIVPAHNEEDLIGACLQSLQVAAGYRLLNGEAVLPIVVLDSCTDGTEDIVRAAGVQCVAIQAANVGIARAVGSQMALDAGARWLLYTDADSVVAPDWIHAHLSQGSDAVCGTVQVVDWGDYDERMRTHFGFTYFDVEGHGHIHGANLGLSAAAYQQAGGFDPLESSEDVALVNALRRQGSTIAWTAAPRVTTSARRSYRAPLGFGATLERIHRDNSYVRGLVAPASL